MTVRRNLAGLLVAGCFAGAAPCVAGQYHGMTQDLLWRQGPSPVWFLFLICLVFALGLSGWLLAGLKVGLDAGKPFRVSKIVVPATGAVCFWVLAWALADVPLFAPLAAPVWLAD